MGQGKLSTGTMGAAAKSASKEFVRNIFSVAIESDIVTAVRNGMKPAEAFGVVLSVVAGIIDHRAPPGTAARLFREFADKLDSAPAAAAEKGKGNG